MSTKREFRRVTFDRKLDVKRLRAALARSMRETAKDPKAEAAPPRLESVLIRAKETTVYLSGNGAGLDAVATALRSSVPGSKVSKASRADAMRPPRDLQPRRYDR
jgi:hypothetical protein